MLPTELRTDPFGLGPVVLAVYAPKGGVGKTLLAMELAYWLGAVLVDADWDGGCATRAWGYRPEDRLRAPLLDALESGRTPRPITGVRKPRLVPSHPDLAVNQPPAEVFASALEQWAVELGCPVIVDTHPGATPTTFGAMAAARKVIVPAILATGPLEALEVGLAELPDYPLLIVPNKVPGSPPMAELERLERITKGLPVAPPISEYRWLPTRKVRVAITSYGDQESRRLAPLARELRAVADIVVSEVKGRG